MEKRFCDGANRICTKFQRTTDFLLAIVKGNLFKNIFVIRRTAAIGTIVVGRGNTFYRIVAKFCPPPCKLLFSKELPSASIHRWGFQLPTRNFEKICSRNKTFRSEKYQLTKI
ncbi:hypothetical protein D9V84_08485 [Bacteroidetes/Chlorobi group bacterium Naka2016]|nr:MAG: hypothetical protein D9V84_08485 [Bacteroidetes/Chlorobi group bacterium Naka2016]